MVSGGLGAILAGGASVGILAIGVLGRWLGWLGAIVAVALIVGSGSVVERDPGGALATVGSLAWLGLLVWIVAASIALLRRPPTESHRLHQLGEPR